jgi:hypothetical protein
MLDKARLGVTPDEGRDSRLCGAVREGAGRGSSIAFLMVCVMDGVARVSPPHPLQLEHHPWFGRSRLWRRDKRGDFMRGRHHLFT